MRISGAWSADAMVLAMDQIFSFAAWIKPPMLPVVSRTKTTSIFVRLGDGRELRRRRHGLAAWAAALRRCRGPVETRPR